MALVYAADAAKLLPGVTIHVIGMWHTRGWINPQTGQRQHLTCTPDKRGRRRYPWAQIAQADADTRATRDTGRRGGTTRPLLAA